MSTVFDHPLWVDDGIVADRVRSEIGPLVKRLDQPHVHVMSVGGVVSLHGEVTDEGARAAIEHATRRVHGVTRIESHLRVGLGPGDSLPSAGRRAQISPLLQRLQHVARECGFLLVTEERHALRAALGVFAARLPYAARRRYLQHLPTDVRHLATPLAWIGSDVTSINTRHDLTQVVALAAPTDRCAAQRLLSGILPILREHAPGDTDVVADALPPELREWWLGGPSAAPDGAGHEPTSTTALPVADVPVSAVMTTNLVTVGEDATLFDAFELMTHAHVHHLPVVRHDGRCVAVLDTASVARHLPEAWVSRTTPPLHGKTAARPVSVLAREPLSKAARVMNTAGVDACCVVDAHGLLLGLLTARDIVAAVAGAHAHA
jgi:CBS domain-containing protein/uncharacterized protein (DUF2267 family)